MFFKRIFIFKVIYIYFDIKKCKIELLFVKSGFLFLMFYVGLIVFVFEDEFEWECLSISVKD